MTWVKRKTLQLTIEKQHALRALPQKLWSYEPWPTEVLALPTRRCSDARETAVRGRKRRGGALPDWPRVSNTLGKGSFALGKGFAECGTRQTALGKKSDGEGTFAECLFSGTRQSLCRVSKSTRQTFRNQIRKTAFKNSKTFYFHPVITPIIQCPKSQVSLLFRVKSRATRLPWFKHVTSCFACSLLYHSNPVLHMSRFCFDSPHIILIRDKIVCLRP